MCTYTVGGFNPAASTCQVLLAAERVEWKTGKIESGKRIDG